MHGEIAYKPQKALKVADFATASTCQSPCAFHQPLKPHFGGLLEAPRIHNYTKVAEITITW